MNVIRFISGRRESWKKLEVYVSALKMGSSLSSTEFKELSKLYRSATSDFSFAETYFPDHDISTYLNKLVAECHGVIYQKKRLRVLDFFTWLFQTVPGIFWSNGRMFLFSMGLFLGFGAVGFLGSEFIPEGEKIFLNFSILNPEGSFYSSENYIGQTEDNINSGDPFAVYNSEDNFLMSEFIFTNNIYVAFNCFVGGIIFGLNTFWSIATTGMMVGAFFHIFYRNGLTADFWNTTLLHGMIELTMIVMAAMAGFMIAKALLFPGKYKRGQALKIKGLEAVQLIIVVSFWLVIAGLFEGYVTGADLPRGLQLTINIITFFALVSYWGVLGFWYRPKKEEKTRFWVEKN